MTESSILDASIEDILSGEVDDSIAYETIDADAILGEVDEFLAENAIKPEESKSTKPEVSAENDEEQLDYDEDPVSINSQPKTSALSAESDARHEQRGGGRRTFNKNFDDGNYYVNPNFRGPYPPDLMGMPRPGPIYMPGPMHPRFYHGYRGPGPMRYPMGGGPPFGPMMYGPPMSGMGPRGGPYGGPLRGPPGRFAGGDRRPLDDAPGNEKKNDKGENNSEIRNTDSYDKSLFNGGGGSQSPTKLPSSRQQPTRPQSKNQSLNNNNDSFGSGQRRRTSSPVNRLPTVRIGGSGTASVSSSQTSTVGGSGSSQPQQQTHIPTMSNVNALISASLRLSAPSSRPNVGPQPTSSVARPTPLMMLPQNPPPSASIQPATQPILTRSNIYPSSTPFIAQQPTVYLDPVRIVPAVAPIVHHPIVQASNMTGGGAMDWSLMVDAFVRRTAEADNRPHMSSSRSYTRSPSGSPSFSSSSSGSRSRFHSRSRSPIPTRFPRSPLSSRRRQRNERRGGRRSVDRHHAPSEAKDEQKRIRECAEAIGLDDDYLRKVEEQKRLRDEFTHQRDQKRQMAARRTADAPPPHRRDNGGKRKDSGAPERERVGRRGDSLVLNRGGGRRTRIEEERNQQRNSGRREPAKSSHGDSSQQQKLSNFTAMPNTTVGGDKVQRGRHNSGDVKRRQAPTAGGGKEALKRKPEQQSAGSGTPAKEISRDGATTTGKLKAYLAVVVSNIKDLENPYKYVAALSDTVGPTKKVWQTSENKISIIFVKHEHAKQFMLQYHGKSLSGSRLDVSLEKVFLNLAASVS